MGEDLGPCACRGFFFVACYFVTTGVNGAVIGILMIVGMLIIHLRGRHLAARSAPAGVGPSATNSTRKGVDCSPGPSQPASLMPKPASAVALTARPERSTMKVWLENGLAILVWFFNDTLVRTLSQTTSIINHHSTHSRDHHNGP